MKPFSEKKVLIMLSFHSFKSFLPLLFALLKDRIRSLPCGERCLNETQMSALTSNPSITSMIQLTLLGNKTAIHKATYLFLIFKLVTWVLIVSRLESASPPWHTKIRRAFLVCRWKYYFQLSLRDNLEHIRSPPQILV